MEPGNLIALVYKGPEVVETLDINQVDGLIVHLEERTWSYQSSQKTKIGDSHARIDPATSERIREGVIGVYNQVITRHMENMKRDALRATQ